MSEKSELNNNLCCKICNKNYKSKNSLCNHIKKFHNNIKLKKSDIQCNETEKSPNDCKLSTLFNTKIVIEYSCRYCKKIYYNKNSRWSHEQKCKHIIKETNELDKLKEETKQKELDTKQKELDTKQKELLLQIKKEETKILELKLKLERSTKIDNITLKKLNNMLMKRNNKIKNINTINNNQQIINNFQLVGFGKEEVIETLTNNDKKLIINARYNSLDKLIEIVHCGKYNQFKNIIITNMKDNYMYKYDDKLGHFVLSTKIDILNSLIDYRLDDLEVIYNDLLDKNKLDENTKDIIEKFINKINIDSKYTDY